MSSISKMELDIRNTIYKYDLYDHISNFKNYYKNKVLDKDWTKNRVSRLSWNGLIFYFFNSAEILNIPMDWISIAVKLKEQFPTWAKTDIPFDKKLMELWIIIKLIRATFSQDESDRADLQENLMNYIDLILATGTKNARDWFSRDLDIILPPIIQENLITGIEKEL